MTLQLGQDNLDHNVRIQLGSEMTVEELPTSPNHADSKEVIIGVGKRQKTCSFKAQGLCLIQPQFKHRLT